MKNTMKNLIRVGLAIASLKAVDACQPYFQYDFEHIGAAQATVSQMLSAENAKSQADQNYLLRQQLQSLKAALSEAKRPQSVDESDRRFAIARRMVPAYERYSPTAREAMKSYEKLIDYLASSNPEGRAGVLQEIEEELAASNHLVPLYEKWVEFHGPWREWRIARLTLPPYRDENHCEKEKFFNANKTVFEALVECGFIATHQVDLTNGTKIDPAIVLMGFLKKNPQISELRIGDEKCLSQRDSLRLGVLHEGVYGYRPFTEADLDPKIMRISNSVEENNDVSIDANDKALWNTLLDTKGEGSFDTIKDLSWYAFPMGAESNKYPFSAIYRLLKVGGEFHIWDHEYVKRSETNWSTVVEPVNYEDERVQDRIKQITALGFKHDPSKRIEGTLVFRK